MTDPKLTAVASPPARQEGKTAADDILPTVQQAHRLLQDLYVRRGAQLPHHVYMAMCYLQVELTARSAPHSFSWLQPGGDDAKTV